MLITGSLECVSPCLSLVIEQVHKHFSDYPYADKDVHPMDPNAHRTMNLVVPAAASGLIIGRGGDTVRALASKSGSHIQLAGRERQIQGSLRDSLVHVFTHACMCKVCVFERGRERESDNLTVIATDQA